MSGSPTEPPGEARRSTFESEISDQPAALGRLLAASHEVVTAGRALAARDPAHVRIVAHGSSDNAAAYGVYALALLGSMTAFRDSISLPVYYGSLHGFDRSAVIALSQSGRTPDVVEYVARARGHGALTIALTNDPASALAEAAELVVPLHAGHERAVAATKTYVNQLAALALLAAAAAGLEDETIEGLHHTAEALDGCLVEVAAAVAPIAVSSSFVGRMFVIGRGVEFATAREIALKLTETCRVAAEPLTATDLAHGPIAAVDGLLPVWAIASHDATLPTVVEASARLRQLGATVIATGNAAHELGARTTVTVPQPPLGVLSPLLSVVPGQLFAAALARAKGLDPDRPHGLEKVTLAA